MKLLLLLLLLLLFYFFFQESPDRKTYYVKVHGSHDTLLRGAEEMLLRMPIQVST